MKPPAPKPLKPRRPVRYRIVRSKPMMTGPGPMIYNGRVTRRPPPMLLRCGEPAMIGLWGWLRRILRGRACCKPFDV